MADVKVTLKRVIDAQGNTDNIHPTTDWDQVENKPSTFTPTAHTLNSHTDVDANPTANGQVLTWDADNSQWIASTTAGGGVSKSDLQNVYIYGKASVAITKGQAIQFAGVEGDHILIKPAVPSEINAEPTLMIGIAETDAAINDFIYVIVNGRLNLDTSTYTAGDLLYFASAGSTAGALVTTEPTDPNASIQMAAVSISGVGNGEFIIRNTILTRQINEVIGLQGALDSKVNKSGDTMSGNLIINGNLNANELYLSDDFIHLRNNASTALQNGEYTGIKASVPDGTNDAWLIFNGDGIARVGDLVAWQYIINFTYSSTQPTSPTPDDVWYDTVNNIWMVFSFFLGWMNLNLPNTVAYVGLTQPTIDKILNSTIASDYPALPEQNDIIANTTTGEIRVYGDTQALATREDNPSSLSIPYWNDTNKRFDTSSVIKIKEVYGRKDISTPTINTTNTNQAIAIGHNTPENFYSIAIGYESLGQSNSTHTIAIGGYALNGVTSGNSNVAIGNEAGRYTKASGFTPSTSISNSIFIGRETRSNADNETNQIVIGYEAEGMGSNTVTLGNDNITATYLKGNVNVTGTVDGVDVATLKSDYDSHTHTFASITSKPTTLSGYGITDAYTQSQVNSQISAATAALVDSSPATLDTLNELAAALGDDPNFATTVSNNIGTKVSKSGDTMTGSLTISNGELSVYNGTGAGVYSRINAADQYHSIVLRGTINGTTSQTVTAGDQITFGEYGGIFKFKQLSTTVNKDLFEITPTDAYFNGTGNFGIGTTSPGAKLEVYQSGNGASNSLIVKDDARQILIGRDEIKGQDLNGNSSTLYINHTGGNIILNGTSGNVGIGTTSPSTKLDVNGKISNGSIWINNGDDNNAYNENIRLFAAPNGVSVIGFNATGTSGTPVTSILGFNDRLETRVGSTWRTRLYSSGLQVNGTITEAGTALSSKYLGISAKAADSNLLDGIDSGSFLRSDATDTATGALTLSNTNNHYSGHHYFDPWDANGNHYPHYLNGSNNNGAQVNMRVYDSGGNAQVFYIDGNSNNMTWRGHTIWNSGNDGSGSGLDADLLDGRSSTSYMYSRGVSSNGDFQTFQSTANIVRFDQVNNTNNLSNKPPGYTYGGVISARGDNFGLQIWGSHTGDLEFKTQWNNDQYSGWRTIWHEGNFNPGSYLTTSGKAADSNLLDGIDSSSFGMILGPSDYAVGTLVTTNINYAVSSGESFQFEIEGKSYGERFPWMVRGQGYIYGGTIINEGIFDYSGNFNTGAFRAFNHNGNLCFWWPRSSYWNNYAVRVYGANGAGLVTNRVTSVTSSGVPSGITKEKYFYSRAAINSSNISSQSVNYANSAGSASSANDSSNLGGVAAANYFRTDGTYPNTDMNATVEGFWHVASNAANLPIASYGHRWDYDHTQNGQWVAQFYSATSGDDSLWFRQKRNYAAQPWQRLWDSTNLSFSLSGTTLTITTN